MRFRDVVGQEAVKDKLLQAAAEGRVSHAQLFLGPEGSGSLAMALAYATYLVCEQADAQDSCGTCPACIKMHKLVHPDVSFSFPVATLDGIKKPRSVDFISQWREAVLENPYLSYNEWVEALNIQNKQGLIAVEEAIDIINRLNLRAAEAPYKIVIIWHADCMNTAAANKLLKVLEEPPGQTLFLLVSEHQDQLLSTILSRTQLVKVNRLPDAVMEKILIEKHAQAGPAARRITHRADGNYNIALQLLAQEEGEHDFNTWFLNWMRACYALQIEEITRIAEKMTREGREMQKLYFEHALQICRECIMINYGDRSLVRIDGKDLEDLSRLAPFINTANAEQIVEELDKAHYHIERNANSRIIFTDLSLALHELLKRKPVLS